MRHKLSIDQAWEGGGSGAAVDVEPSGSQEHMCPRENNGVSSDSFLVMESNCKGLIRVMASRKMMTVGVTDGSGPLAVEYLILTIMVN